MITPIVLKPANAGRTKVVIIYYGIFSSTVSDIFSGRAKS